MPGLGQSSYCGKLAGRLMVLSLLLLTIHTPQSAEIEALAVNENRGVYQISMVTRLDASPEQVHFVLTDYTHIYRLVPSLVEAEVLPDPGNGAVRVRTRLHDCIFIFCMSIDRVEDVFENGQSELQMKMIPALSSFRSGNAIWTITRSDDGSHVVYQAEVEPAFTVLPVLGTALLKRKLRSEMERSIRRIECVAKIRDQLEWNPHMKMAGARIDAACSSDCAEGRKQCQP